MLVLCRCQVTSKFFTKIALFQILLFQIFFQTVSQQAATSPEPEMFFNVIVELVITEHVVMFVLQDILADQQLQEKAVKSVIVTIILIVMIRKVVIQLLEDV